MSYSNYYEVGKCINSRRDFRGNSCRGEHTNLEISGRTQNFYVVYSYSTPIFIANYGLEYVDNNFFSMTTRKVQGKISASLWYDRHKLQNQYPVLFKDIFNTQEVEDRELWTDREYWIFHQIFKQPNHKLKLKNTEIGIVHPRLNPQLYVLEDNPFYRKLNHIENSKVIVPITYNQAFELIREERKVA